MVEVVDDDGDDVCVCVQGGTSTEKKGSFYTMQPHTEQSN